MRSAVLVIDAGPYLPAQLNCSHPSVHQALDTLHTAEPGVDVDYTWSVTGKWHDVAMPHPHWTTSASGCRRPRGTRPTLLAYLLDGLILASNNSSRGSSRNSRSWGIAAELPLEVAVGVRASVGVEREQQDVVAAVAVVVAVVFVIVVVIVLAAAVGVVVVAIVVVVVVVVIVVVVVVVVKVVVVAGSGSGVAVAVAVALAVVAVVNIVLAVVP